jgi:hypothetical protein
MSSTLKKIVKGIWLKSESTDPTENLEGSVWSNSVSSRLKTYIEAAIREVVTNDQAQTLTNKTIVAANNTITTAASGNLTSTELNAALAELQGDIDTKGPAIVTKEEGVTLTSTTTSYDFVGSGVTATNIGNAVTVTVTGGGDVVGPASAVDNSLPLYDGTTGKLLKAGVAVGTAGQVLTSNGASAPSFQTLPSPVRYEFKVNGPLSGLGSQHKRLDGAIISEPFIPSSSKAALETNGKTGTLILDVRRHTPLALPITKIDSVDNAVTLSVAKVGTSLATQSIANASGVASIATQSITRAKSSLTASSIIPVQGTNKFRINLATAADADWSIGASITISGATDSGNNVTAVIEDKNVEGLNNLIITNATGVMVINSQATVNLALFSLNYSSTVSSQFVAGENVNLGTAHTSTEWDGQHEIYKINQSGNNIWIYNATGVVQAGVAGTAICNRWQYNLLSPASTTNYVVGEQALMASHTSGANNGNFPIRAVNSGGNNIIVYNEAGVAQAGVLGNINTNRWNYNYNPNAIKAIAYSSSLTLFAAVASSGEILTSPDGITWTQRVSPEKNKWNGIAFGNGVFVAVASTGTHRVMTSSDGITWILRNASQANSWNAVAYNAGAGSPVFCAVASDGTNRVMTSPDGITWTNRTASTNNDYKAICANSAGRFVAIADQVAGASRSMTSTDGTTWTSVGALATVSTWTSIASDGTNFIAVASSGATQVASCGSTGATWTSQTPASSNAWQAVTYVSGLSLFVAVASSGSGNRVMTAPNLTTWTSRTSAADNSWSAIANDGTNLVAVSTTGSSRAMTSSNGTSWTSRTPALITLASIVGDQIKLDSHTSTANDGVFTIKTITQVTDSQDVVVYNESGVAQAAQSGELYSAKKLVTFASDQSSTITTSSRIELSGTSESVFEEGSNDIGYAVSAINQNGGFNAVITEPDSITQYNPAGYVVMESKSLYSSAPSIAGTSLSTNQPLKGIAGDYGTLIASSVPANSYISLWVIQNFTDSSARDLTVILG